MPQMTDNQATERISSPRLALATALAVFALLALLVALEQMDAVDRAILEHFRASFGSVVTNDRAWLRDLMNDVSSLGGAPVLVLVAGGACAALLIYGKKRHAIVMILAALGGQISIEIMKTLFNRARPGTEIGLEGGFPRGFPSGHTGEATIVFLTLATIITTLNLDRRVKTLAFGLAILASFSVGMSRLYLDDHWPSDVVAAWVLGTAWALFAQLIVQRSAHPR
jgi:undecaprenyl-diphosphatase